MLVTITSKEKITLDYILYIYYLVNFWRNSNYIGTLIAFDSKVNIITFIYTSKLDLQVWKTDIENEKID